MSAGKRLTLRTPINDRITVETFDERGLYLTYVHEGDRRMGPVGCYPDELLAREAHLRWVMLDWNAPLQSGPRKPQLLVAEDEYELVGSVLKAFERPPAWNVTHVDDGTGALDFLYKRKPYHNAPTPDLVLLDLLMPKLRGFEVLEMMKSDPQLRSIPVVIWCISERDEDISRAFRKGAEAYYIKQPRVSEEIENLTLIRRFWEQRLAAPSGSPSGNRL